MSDDAAGARRVTVWGTGTPRTLRVYWALHELDVPFSRHRVRTRTSDMDDGAFLAVSPGRKIPGFEHGSLRLTESGAIVDYLFDRFGPESPRPDVRAEIARWSYFTLTEIDATALYVMRRHRDLPEVYGEAPAAVAAAIGYFERQAGVVNDVLSDRREFIAGEALSPADIHLVTCCVWAGIYGLALPGYLDDYQARHRSRPAFEHAAASNGTGA